MSALGCRRIGAARIRERRGRRLQALKLLDALLVGDGEQHDVAPLLGAPDGEEAHARRRRRQRAAVGVGGGRVDQLPGSAGDSMQEVRGEGTAADAGR